jgi:hypothetical protein
VYSFEHKWDGIRALTAVETAGWRLWGRERIDYTARFPELDVLRRLPAETLLDGELVGKLNHMCRVTRPVSTGFRGKQKLNSPSMVMRWEEP